MFSVTVLVLALYVKWYFDAITGGRTPSWQYLLVTHLCLKLGCKLNFLWFLAYRVEFVPQKISPFVTATQVLYGGFF